MKKHTIKLAFIALMATGCVAHKVKSFSSDSVFLNIIANPLDFDGKTVTVKAWMTLRHEDNNLWATQEDQENWDARRCISLTNYDTLKSLESLYDGRYVQVTGIVRSDAEHDGKVVRLASCQKLALEIAGQSSIKIISTN